MSLNNVRQYALMLMLLCGAAGLSGVAQADDGACDMMSAVKKVDYGRYRKEDMRKASTEHVGKVYNGYASVTREFQVSVLCPDARKLADVIDEMIETGMLGTMSVGGKRRLKVMQKESDGAPF